LVNSKVGQSQIRRSGIHPGCGKFHSRALAFFNKQRFDATIPAPSRTSNVSSRPSSQQRTRAMGNAGSHGMQGEQHLMSFDCCGGSRLDEVRNAQLILPCPRVCSHVRMLQPFHGRSRSGSRSRLFQDCINARHGRQNDNCSVASTTQDPAPLRVTSRLTSRKRACARLDLKEREAAALRQQIQQRVGCPTTQKNLQAQLQVVEKDVADLLAISTGLEVDHQIRNTRRGGSPPRCPRSRTSSVSHVLLW